MSGTDRSLREGEPVSLWHANMTESKWANGLSVDLIVRKKCKEKKEEN